ncbi:MAG: hypothetical protein LUH11_04220 [Candidatus Gastranaerophilales bacterium]|nr:hypothetical protein [Candidatus Gastranaerophilales bacterium]
MIKKSLFKIICFTSLITGAMIGILPLIPPLIWIAFLAVMFLSAPFMIIYLKKLNLINKFEIEESLVIGSISGAFAFLGFAVVYFPAALILYLIFKIQSFLWIKVMFTNFGFLISMIILITLLSALLNMFSGFLTVYLCKYNKSEK